MVVVIVLCNTIVYSILFSGEIVDVSGKFFNFKNISNIYYVACRYFSIIFSH